MKRKSITSGIRNLSGCDRTRTHALLSKNWLARISPSKHIPSELPGEANNPVPLNGRRRMHRG